MNPFLRMSSRTAQVTVLLLVIVSIFLVYSRNNQYGDLIVGLNKSLQATSESTNPTSIPSSAGVDWPKPAGQRVIGLVFYGRRNRVNILNCYLERNLPENGGWLDEVHFVRNTKNDEDLVYLEALVASNSRYKVLELGFDGNDQERYSSSWTLLEPNAIYVKIDDDVVFLADDTIPRLVVRKTSHPEYLVVSANLINSPLMSKVHYDHGAYHPYLPIHDSLPFETITQLENTRKSGNSSWEFTQYPNWTGPETYALDHDEPTTGLSPIWLRLPNASDILRTPIRNVTYDTWGPGCKSWSIAAQSHLSLLENLYFNNTLIYYNALNEVWFTDYDRLSINLIAVDSNEILTHLPVDEGIVDEEWITVTLPQRLQKHVVVETRALAAHFSFSFQNAIEYTDILDRYADFAVKEACLNPGLFGRSIITSARYV